MKYLTFQVPADHAEPLKDSANIRPFIRKRHGNRLRRVVVAGCLLASVGFGVAPRQTWAQDLDLNGLDGVLPQGTSFGGQAYLNGVDNVRNNNGTPATLTEGGGLLPPNPWTGAFVETSGAIT